MSTKIEISADINAPVEKVWKFWTKPEHITRWNFASPEWCCPTAENDLTVGGRYSARMEAKDGSFGFDFSATYHTIEMHKKIGYTLDDQRDVTTTFDTKDSKTIIQTVFDAETTNPIEMQKEGWQAILNNFKKYVEEH